MMTPETLMRAQAFRDYRVDDDDGDDDGVRV